MASKGEPLIELYERKLTGYQRCLQLMREKTRILMANDLPALEDSLDREARLLQELAELDSSISEFLKNARSPVEPDHKNTAKAYAKGMEPQFSAQLMVICKSLEDTSKKIRSVIHKNALLITGGLQFTSVMLEACCPVRTYTPSGKGSQVPATAILSVNY